MTRDTALVVRGGWDGHQPVEQTELIIPYLSSLGLEVVVAESTEPYEDADLLARTALVVQQWTMGELSREATASLQAAVADGMGFAGWHGGIVDSFRISPGYLQLTGGQFVAHPGGIIPFEVTVVSDDPIVAGISGFAVTSEQYWVLSDALNEVLAETTIPAGDDWHTPVTVPAVWKRQWGTGRVFVSTIGHTVDDLAVPEVRTILERGLAWAAGLS